MPMTPNKLALAMMLASLSIYPAVSQANSEMPRSDQQAEAVVAFKVAAQPLEQALMQFGRQSKLQLSYKPDMVQGKISAGVEGTYTAKQALNLLLSGTGIRAKYIDNNAVILVQADQRSLSAIKVEGQSNTEVNAWSEVEGFVVLRSHAGSKTDTPIIETPQAISVVNSAMIQSRGSDSVSQSLRYSSGIHPFAHFDTTTDLYTIRGIESDNGIFLDGTQHRVNRFDSAIEPFGVERIEVIKGPSSVLYGANSPGGLINAVSKQPLGKQHGEVGISVGSYQRKQFTADIGGQLPSAAMDYRIATLVRNSDTQIEHIQDDRTFIAPSMTWNVSDRTSLTLLSYYQEDKTDYAFGYPMVGSLTSGAKGKLDDDLFLGEPGFNGTEREHYSVGYMLDHQFSDSLSLRQNVRYFDSTADRHEMWSSRFLADSGTLLRLPAARHQNSDSLTIDNQLQYLMDSGLIQHKILAGIDYRKTHFDQEISTDLAVFAGNPTKYALDLYNPVYGVTPVTANTLYSSQETDSKQLGVYLQNQMTINDNVIATLSGRYDRADGKTINGRFNTAAMSVLKDPAQRSDDNEFTSRVGLAYLSETGFAPYYSYSESFLPITGVDSNNKTLKPETGKQNELGVKFQSESANSFMTMALFDLVRENVKTTDTTGEQINQTGEIRSQGIELEATASFDNGLSLTSAYTHTEARIKKSLSDYEEGLTPLRIPEDTASMWLEYHPQMAALNGLSVGVGGRFTGRTYDQSNRISVASFSVFDASASYRLKNWSLSLNATNMFDRQYVAQCRSDVDQKTGIPTQSDCSFGKRRQINLSAQYHWGE